MGFLSWEALLQFLAILNPFALCLYLTGPMEELSFRSFLRVFLSACGISLAVFYVCAYFGEGLFTNTLGLEPAALRVFGGVVFFFVGYQYVTKGYRTTETLRGSLEELPSAIALPFMIGAGTIAQSVLIGKRYPACTVGFTLAGAMVFTIAVVMGFKLARDHLRGARERIFDRWVNIMARVNGLLIGAISCQLVVGGIYELWIHAQQSPLI
jgi:small neutral amino acid transporter SnatA (MarC family)